LTTRFHCGRRSCISDLRHCRVPATTTLCLRTYIYSYRAGWRTPGAVTGPLREPEKSRLKKGHSSPGMHQTRQHCTGWVSFPFHPTLAVEDLRHTGGWRRTGDVATGRTGHQEVPRTPVPFNSTPAPHAPAAHQLDGHLSTTGAGSPSTISTVAYPRLPLAPHWRDTRRHIQPRPHGHSNALTLWRDYSTARCALRTHHLLPFLG